MERIRQSEISHKANKKKKRKRSKQTKNDNSGEARGVIDPNAVSMVELHHRALKQQKKMKLVVTNF